MRYLQKSGNFDTCGRGVSKTAMAEILPWKFSTDKCTSGKDLFDDKKVRILRGKVANAKMRSACSFLIVINQVSQPNFILL